MRISFVKIIVNEYNHAAAEGYFNKAARLLLSGTDRKCGLHYPSSRQFDILLSSGTDQNMDTTALPQVNRAFHGNILDQEPPGSEVVVPHSPCLVGAPEGGCIMVLLKK